MRLRTLFFFATLLLIFDTYATDKLKLELSYAIDLNDEYSFDERSNIPFQDISLEYLNIGYNVHPVWMKVKVYSDSEMPNQFFKIEKTLTDSLSFYKQEEGVWYKQLVGIKVENSDTHPSGYYLPVQLQKGENVFYLKIKSNFSHLYELSITNRGQLEKGDYYQNIKHGLLLGLFIVIVLYNLFLGINLKDSMYAYYALHGLIIMFSLLSLEGFFSQKFMNVSSSYIYLIITLNICLASVVSCWFCIKFLNLKKTNRLFYHIMIALMGVDLVSFLGIFILQQLGYQITYYTLTTVTTVYCIFAFMTGVISYRKGNKVAKFYLMGWTVYFLGIISQAFVLYGILDPTYFNKNFYIIAIISEVLLMSFALADRYKKIRKDQKSLEHTLANKQDNLDVVLLDNIRRQTVQDKLIEQLKEITKSDDIEKGVRSLILDLSQQKNTDVKQLHFQENIEEVDVQFLKRLKQLHPQLTSTELEICSLLKLNYNTKEIASFRQTSEGAVKTNKSRIKKKIGAETTLNDYIMSV
ncbi:hypothetical protein KMW28_03765 [Flammeovirga yaeyamensis]|uniref:HTH luxR-type domain-containing protein n=1 Tax=Flammeovirga yaeyamensis TaxID=367791 RepID=A0AAX1N5Y8_9BACT|nr:7TM diverse intracellular signaling domain-containing protein [Flammeovirga yaeyamensis]MBB3701235.1 DNA-binding CsgD family transcriptional regulator [Flammeovirga yaeyamensis]NMF38294.1 hypothetical protein [Flammeovirga yaeyamensis]QWG02706.1 hypothetical protein KMW28_03765 [Flammeovirga yaeyamensis]